MTTATLIAASPRPAPQLDLDTRLALLGALMDERLDKAAVAFEVNTAHIEGADPIPDISEAVPLTPTLAPNPNPYNTPLAALLHRAHVYIATHGLHQGHLRDENGPAYGAARCLIGAIRIEADNRHQADDACTLLDELIRRDHPNATIPSWNDAQPDASLPLHYLNQAAHHAHTRNL